MSWCDSFNQQGAAAAAAAAQRSISSSRSPTIRSPAKGELENMRLGKATVAAGVVLSRELSRVLSREVQRVATLSAGSPGTEHSPGLSPGRGAGTTWQAWKLVDFSPRAAVVVYRGGGWVLENRGPQPTGPWRCQSIASA
jgi:hypothetical protein